MSVTFTPGKLISIEYGGVIIIRSYYYFNNFDIEYDIVNTGREERGEAYEIPRLQGGGGNQRRSFSEVGKVFDLIFILVF